MGIDAQKPTVSSAREEMSAGHHPALAADVGRSAGSSPRGGFSRVPCSKASAVGLGKSNSSWCWSPLGTSRVSGRHRRVPKLLARFCFLQQLQFTNEPELTSSLPPLPSPWGGQRAGSHRAQEEALLQGSAIEFSDFQRTPHLF